MSADTPLDVPALQRLLDALARNEDITLAGEARLLCTLRDWLTSRLPAIVEDGAREPDAWAVVQAGEIIEAWPWKASAAYQAAQHPGSVIEPLYRRAARGSAIPERREPETLGGSYA
jgi:hypothetical protein